MDLKGLVQRAVGALREGIEEFVKGFIHKQLDPVCADPGRIWDQVGEDVLARVRAALPSGTVSPEMLDMVRIAALVAMGLWAERVRAELLGQAERINPADGVA